MLPIIATIVVMISAPNQNSPVSIPAEKVPPALREKYQLAIKGNWGAMVEVNRMCEGLGLSIYFPWENIGPKIKNLAEKGDACAAYAWALIHVSPPLEHRDELGLLTSPGISDGKINEALMKRAAELGDPRAMLWMAERETWRQRRILLDEHDAQYAQLPMQKRPKFQEPEKASPMALHWANQAYLHYLKKADRGDREAISLLGHKGFGAKGVMDPAQEEHWRQKAVEIGDPDLLYKQAVEMMFATKNREEFDKGWATMLRAAELHNDKAMKVVAEDYYVGTHLNCKFKDPTFKRDRKKAKEWVDRIVEYFGSIAPLADSGVFNPNMDGVDLKKLFSK